MRNRKQEGFTLIELLIVIAIIGILAAVLIPNLLTARVRAFDTAAQSCAKQIATAQEVSQIDHQTYQGSLANLDPGIVSVCDAAWVTNASGDASTYSFTVKHTGNTNTKTFVVTPTGIQ